MSSKQGPHVVGMRASANAAGHRRAGVCIPITFEEVAA